jgi:hypothetical protein
MITMGGDDLVIDLAQHIRVLQSAETATGVLISQCS